MPYSAEENTPPLLVDDTPPPEYIFLVFRLSLYHWGYVDCYNTPYEEAPENSIELQNLRYR